jgi:Sporulation and spore germination
MATRAGDRRLIEAVRRKAPMNLNTHGAVALAALGGVLVLAQGTPATPSADGGPGVRGLARVEIFAPRGSTSTRCERVYPLARSVRGPAVLGGAMRALLAGPTAAERARGYGGWFSARTAGRVRSVRLSGGIAYVDFRDFRRIIPNASSSCGSTLLLAQLNRTATQFPTVRAAVYSFDGSRRAFYEWLQLAAPGRMEGRP